MRSGGVGGSNTLTGLDFEQESDLLGLLDSLPGYSIRKAAIGKDILYNNNVVANCYRKHDLYRYLDSKQVDWKSILSKKLLPDDAVYVIRNNTLFIIEIKYQQVAGSVDEKLQTCDFKKKQYKRLFSQLNIEVEYVYVLSRWFKQPQYKDVLNYIISVDCHYYFQYLPLQKLGLPVPQAS